MFLAYVDESFDQDLFHLGAIVIEPEVAHAITQELEALAREVRGSYGFLEVPEFHGYEMFHGEDSWLHMKGQVRARVGIYHDVVDIIAREGVIFMVKCISARALAAQYLRPYPREQVAWTYLLQDINERCWNHGELALVIADQVSEDETRRRELAQMRRVGTFASYRRTTLPNIIDTLHFAPSHHSRLIQAIDCALFIVQRRRSRADTDDRAIAQVARLHEKLDERSSLWDSGVWPR